MKGTWALTCIYLLALTSSAIQLRAENAYWQHDPASQGDWFDPGNWSTGLVPGLADTAYIDNDGTALIGSGAVGISGLHVGEALTGVLIQSGGDVAVSSVGVTEGSQYDLTGGTLLIHDSFDLSGTLDFGGGNATFTIAGDA